MNAADLKRLDVSLQTLQLGMEQLGDLQREETYCIEEYKKCVSWAINQCGVDLAKFAKQRNLISKTIKRWAQGKTAPGAGRREEVIKECLNQIGPRLLELQNKRRKHPLEVVSLNPSNQSKIIGFPELCTGT